MHMMQFYTRNVYIDNLTLKGDLIMMLNKLTFNGAMAATLFSVSALFLSLDASAQSVHRDWEAHAKETYCYNVSFPEATTHIERPYRTYVSVTQRPLEGVSDEVSFVSGLNPQADVLGHVKVDNNETRTLLVHDGAGFVSSEEESSLINEMVRGYEMTVTWTYGSGNKVVDNYSLLGFTASRNSARRSCR